MEKDKTRDSLPEGNKFAIRGRNFTAWRVPLGQRLELARFYTRLIGPIAGELGVGDPSKFLDKILARLPDLLAEIGKEYIDIIPGCTNMPVDFIEQECEIEDIYFILRKIAEVNNFGKTMKSLKEEGKKNTFPTGSNAGSPISA